MAAPIDDNIWSFEERQKLSTKIEITCKSMLPYRDQPPCENKHCQVLRQELDALKATPKPRHRLEWRTFDGVSGAVVATVFSLFVLMTTLGAYCMASPEPSIITLAIAWPVVPFIFMLHMLKIVKR